MRRLLRLVREAFAQPRKTEPFSPLRAAADNYRGAMSRALEAERKEHPC